MDIRKNVDLSKPLTAEQKEMLNALSERPVTPDNDCPELTSTQLEMFRRISETRRDERRKQSVTLRLSPQALRRARSLGKGYTSVLSRILENALNDPEEIRKKL